MITPAYPHLNRLNARCPVWKALSSVVFLLGFVLYIPLSYAQTAVYTVDGKLEAVFPSQPQLTGNLGQGVYQMRGFNASDETNIIAYTASYQIEKAPTEEPIEQAIKNYIRGQVLVVNGTSNYQKIVQIGSETGGHFSIGYVYRGIPVRKYGAVIHHNGRFYQWAVQSIPGVSKLDGQDIFNGYVKYFRVMAVEGKKN